MFGLGRLGLLIVSVIAIVRFVWQNKPSNHVPEIVRAC